MQVNVDTSWINTQLGNHGLVLYVADNGGKHRGTLRIGKATAEWCQGRTRMGNGRKVRLEELIAFIEDR